MDTTTRNILVIAVIAIILIGLIVWLFNRNSVLDELNQQTVTPVPGQTAMVRGEIQEVNSERVPVDGPTVITVRSDEGVDAAIAVPSMGFNLCQARQNIANVSLLREGMVVEARGTLDATGYVVPCEGTDHYLRVVGE